MRKFLSRTKLVFIKIKPLSYNQLFALLYYLFNIKEENELKRTLQSLACGKVPILIKSSKVILFF